MPDYFTLTCPSCGGRLQITNDMDRFACGNCGNELIVKRGGGTISLAPVVEELKGVKTGVDKTASELAIVRLNQEIDNLYSQRDEGPGFFSVAIIFIIFTGLAMLFYIMAAASGYVTLGIFLGLAFFGFGIWLITYIERSNPKNEPIDKLIAQKQEELEWHQSIVSGQRQ
jgi:hypothetical protein